MFHVLSSIDHARTTGRRSSSRPAARSKAGCLVLLAAAASLLAPGLTAHAQCTGRFLNTVPFEHPPGVGIGFNDTVHTLVSKDGRLYAGGAFDAVDGVSAKAIARWDGIAWRPVQGGMHHSAPGVKPVVHAMSVRPSILPHIPSSLAVGGEFSRAGGPPGALGSVPAGNVASYSDSGAFFDWQPLAAGLAGDVRATAIHGAVLYAGGDFQSEADAELGGVAHWTGTRWEGHPLPGFVHGYTVLALQPFGGQLIAGGDFGSQGYNFIAALTGSSWTFMGTGMNGQVRGLTVYDGELIAGGAFITAGGVTTNGIARWNGSTWRTIGVFPLTSVYDVAVYNNRLYAAGVDISTNRSVLRVWNGTAWSAEFFGALGTWIDSLTVHNGELILGGRFDHMEIDSHNWARWSDSGKPWLVQHPEPQSVLAGGTVGFSAQPVAGYESFGAVSYQWRRNGQPITDGPGGAAPGGGIVLNASGTLEPGAFAELVIVGARPADQGGYDCVISTPCASTPSRPAALTVSSDCPADYTQDGIVDFSDFLEFLNAFNEGDIRADFTSDGVIDFSDYLEFLNHFDAGC